MADPACLKRITPVISIHHQGFSFIDFVLSPFGSALNADRTDMRNEGMRMTHDDMSHLLDAILCLKTRDELERFFDDLCTIQEINSMVQRFDVALQLDKGLTYSQIAGVTHASTATISRVNRSLVYGAEGYKLAIARLRKEDKGDE